MAEVTPTRMELIKTKDRIALAKKGHKLLKQKRDALILEFFELLKKAKNLRGELNEQIRSAYKSLYTAQMYHSLPELENVALNCRKDISVDMEVRNVMGVKIPSIEMENVQISPPILERGYSIVGTSAKIDNAVDNFSKVFEMTLKIAETETAIKRLILEIEKTKRRVNALEFVLLPKLEEQKKMIQFRLDEMERDSFVSLKVIKRKLEQKAKEKD
ncbi:V-type ATP synthase subunit D [Candidatus Micrarchaeota archaeon]|nr:V-type ATP synthase subunit D [Candidatus Micrarchaeota archaeon]